LYWNKNAISDIGVAALLSFAALQGAALNVKINLPGITDRSVKADTLEKVHEYLNEGEKLNNQIAAIVKSRIEE
jgi:formiminotetrahydrofolate cyclodeaminase